MTETPFDLKNRRGILLGLVLTVIVATAYFPAMHDGGFVWDDDDYVTQNETLRTVDGLWQIWSNPKATPQYYPLVHTTYWIEYRFWELNPTGYHVTNVVLHAMVALLLWLVLLQLKIPGAWLAATLFAAHPVHVESVAWITERKNVLSGVFYLTAALAYLKWMDAKAEGARRPSLYWAAFILFICALLSKTVTATLPAALLLVAWWQTGFADKSESAQGRFRMQMLWRHLRPLVPFFVIGLTLALLTVWLEKHHVGAHGTEWQLTFIDRCLIAGRALWFYASKTVWPHPLIFNYPRWEIDASIWWQYLFPLSFLAVIAILWFARKRIGRGPLAAMLFFAGSLFPALGFIDVYPMRYSFVADHFNYLPSIGVLVLIGAGIIRLGRFPHFQNKTALQSISLGIILALLTFLSARQSQIYQNLETLYRDTIAKNPASWMAYNNLGQFYLKEDKPEAAMPLIRQALRHNPKDVDAILNLGVALSRLNRLEEAMEQYHHALEYDPDESRIYSNIGAVLAKQEKFDDAVANYQKSLELAPDFAPTHSNIGAALASLGRFEEAIPHHEKAVALAPKLPAIRLKFGEALHLSGRLRDAEHQYREAISLDPSLAEAHLNLGLIALADQLIPAALDHFRRATKYAPNFVAAHRNLAKTLAAVGRTDDAVTHFKRTLELAPQSPRAYLDYADFLAQTGNLPAARTQLLAAAEIMPKNADLLFQIGMLNLQLGDPGAAHAQFRTVLDVAPDHGPAHNYLAVMIASQGKLPEAVNLLRQAVKLNPDNAEFHNNLGVVLVRLGNRREALQALETAVRLQPDYAEARKNRDDLKTLLQNEQDSP